MMLSRTIKHSSLALLAVLLAMPLLVQAAPTSDQTGISSTDRFHRHYNVMEQRPETELRPYWVYRHPSNTPFYYHRSYAELQRYTGARNTEAYRMTSPVFPSTVY